MLLLKADLPMDKSTAAISSTTTAHTDQSPAVQAAHIRQHGETSVAHSITSEMTGERETTASSVAGVMCPANVMLPAPTAVSDQVVPEQASQTLEPVFTGQCRF